MKLGSVQISYDGFFEPF